MILLSYIVFVSSSGSCRHHCISEHMIFQLLVLPSISCSHSRPFPALPSNVATYCMYIPHNYYNVFVDYSVVHAFLWLENKSRVLMSEVSWLKTVSCYTYACQYN